MLLARLLMLIYLWFYYAMIIICNLLAIGLIVFLLPFAFNLILYGGSSAH